MAEAHALKASGLANGASEVALALPRPHTTLRVLVKVLLPKDVLQYFCNFALGHSAWLPFAFDRREAFGLVQGIRVKSLTRKSRAPGLCGAPKKAPQHAWLLQSHRSRFPVVLSSALRASSFPGSYFRIFLRVSAADCSSRVAE